MTIIIKGPEAYAVRMSNMHLFHEYVNTQEELLNILPGYLTAKQGKWFHNINCDKTSIKRGYVSITRTNHTMNSQTSWKDIKFGWTVNSGPPPSIIFK
jgi:hypothetical protein